MGFDESRGTLFFHIARAAKEIQPRYLLLENVKGLVSHDQGRTLTVILNTLQELGYGHIEWGIFNSKFWGVPQNRERIFIVAELTNEPQRPYLLDLLKDQEEIGVQTRLRDILETDVDEKYYLSDEKTKGLIEKIEKDHKVYDCIDSRQASIDKVRIYDGICPTLSATDAKDVKKVIVPRTQVVADLNHYSQEALNRVYGINGQAPTLDTMQGGGREPKIAEPIVYCLNTWKEDGTQTRMQDRIYDSKGVSVALTSFSDRLNVLLEKPMYRIRKLTPLECWRLQGFSDEQHQAATDDGLSDSQRYKQAGNSVTVNVIEAIAQSIVERMEK